MLRHLSLVVVALAVASCGGPVSKADCATAGQAGTWDVNFSLSQGDATKCPVLTTKSIQLPNQCEANCGCTEASVVFEPAQNSALQDKCSVRFHEVCPAYELDCRYVDVASPTSASGNCFYKVGTLSCGYSVSWAKKQ